VSMFMLGPCRSNTYDSRLPSIRLALSVMVVASIAPGMHSRRSIGRHRRRSGRRASMRAGYPPARTLPRSFRAIPVAAGSICSASLGKLRKKQRRTPQRRRSNPPQTYRMSRALPYQGARECLVPSQQHFPHGFVGAVRQPKRETDHPSPGYVLVICHMRIVCAESPDLTMTCVVFSSTSL
jgi:hypothetical protein